jgi:hypothetical protein
MSSRWLRANLSSSASSIDLDEVRSIAGSAISHASVAPSLAASHISQQSAPVSNNSVHDDDGSDSGGDSGGDDSDDDDSGGGIPVKASSPTLKKLVDLADIAKIIALGFSNLSLCAPFEDSEVTKRAVLKINTTLVSPSGVLQSLMEIELTRLKASWADASRRGLNIGPGYKTVTDTIFRPHEEALSMIDPKRSKLNRFAQSLVKRKEIEVHNSDFRKLASHHATMIDDIGTLVDAVNVRHLKRDFKTFVKKADDAWGKVGSAISDAVGAQGVAKALEAARKRRVADDAKEGTDKWGRVEDEMERPDLAPLYNVPVIGNTFA